MIAAILILAVLVLAACVIAPCMRDDELDAQDAASRSSGRRSPSGDAPAVVCAWCGDTIRSGSTPASNGMCPDCYAKCRAEIRATVPLGASIPPERWAIPSSTINHPARRPPNV